MKNAFLLALKRYAAAYTLINIVFLVVCFAVQRRLNIDISFLRVSAGALVISLFVTLSVTLFKMNKGNEIIKIALGLFALAPVVVITRRIFGVMVFRYSYIVYLFAILCALIYSIAVVTVAHRAKREAKELNSLLADSRECAEKKEREDVDAVSHR